jgi:hypothetical protein
LLLQPVDLDDQTILDDHTNLAMPDVLDGNPDLIQLEIAGGEWTGDPILFPGT